jgi:hypothetical protein
MALRMMHAVFEAVDSLSCILQAADRTVIGAHESVCFTLNQRQKLRADDQFDMQWNHTQSKVTEFGLNEIKLPRFNRQPARYDVHSNQNAHRFGTAKDYYRVNYFTFLNSVIIHIIQGFEQHGMVMYSKMETR